MQFLFSDYTLDIGRRELRCGRADSQLWGERYDRCLEDVFAVQDEITDAIVATIEPRVYAVENFHAQRKPPESLDAWDLVMRALPRFWRLTRKDNLAAKAKLVMSRIMQHGDL